MWIIQITETPLDLTQYSATSHTASLKTIIQMNWQLPHTVLIMRSDHTRAVGEIQASYKNTSLTNYAYQKEG